MIARRLMSDFASVNIPIVVGVSGYSPQHPDGDTLELLHYDFLDELNVFERVFVMAQVEAQCKEHGVSQRLPQEPWNVVQLVGLPEVAASAFDQLPDPAPDWEEDEIFRFLHHRWEWTGQLPGYLDAFLDANPRFARAVARLKEIIE